MLADWYTPGPQLYGNIWISDLEWTSLITLSDNLYSLPSIDLLDMAFNYMDIEDETCRMKTICQAESYAVQHPVARLAINTLK